MSTSAIDPILRIGTLDALPRRSRLALAPLSVAVHVAAVMALILVPIFGSTELPEPTASVRAFLVEPPAIAAPPPPPPPPAPSAAAARTSARELETARFVAPIETPNAIAEEQGLDLGIEGGVAGGVEGGVAGGVVGGIIGGLGEAPAPHAPVRVGGQIVEPRKLKHVAPEYPLIARDARIRGTVILEAVIDTRGRVDSLKVLRSVPLLDEAALNAVRQWVYTPTLLDGIPVPVIMNITVQFSLRN